MRHVWSVLCEKSTIDQETNNLSLIDIVEKFTVSGSIDELTKATESEGGMRAPLQLSLVSFWSRGDEKEGDYEFDMKVQFVDPSGEKLNNFEKEVPVEEGFKRIRTRVQIDGFQITQPGVYQVKVMQRLEDDFEEVASIPVEIAFAKDSE